MWNTSARVGTLLPVNILNHPVRDGLVVWATPTGSRRVPVGKKPFGKPQSHLGITVLRTPYGITIGLPRNDLARNNHGMRLPVRVLRGNISWYQRTGPTRRYAVRGITFMLEWEPLKSWKIGRETVYSRVLRYE